MTGACAPNGAAPAARLAHWPAMAFAISSAGLLIAFFAVPSVVVGLWLYLAFGVTGVLAVVVGTVLHKPADRRPWRFIAAGLALYVLGDSILFSYEFRGVSTPFPSVADAAYLLGVPLLLRGMHLFVRTRSDPSDRPGRMSVAVLDAAMLTSSAAVAVWVFMMAPIVADRSLTGFGSAISLAYPILDIALLYFGLRLFHGWRRLSPALVALILGIDALFLADIVYAWLLATGSYTPRHPVDALWLLSYGSFGLAALHPSMRSLGRVRAPSTAPLGTRRLAALSLLWLAPTIALLGADGRTALLVAVLGSGAVFALVLARMWSVVRDLEVRVSQAESVRIAAEDAERVADGLRIAQRQFATMAAHELRTPLTGLIGSLDTLVRVGSQSAVEVELTQIAVRQAARLSRLTDDLLVVASTDLEVISLTEDVVEVGTCVQLVIAQLDCESKVTTSGLDVAVRGDPLRITQVLSNLVRNAVEHAREGTLVDIKASPRGAFVAIEIHNSGRPISAGRLTTIFDQFGHGDESRTGGLGVGLWIVRRLILAMGGEVAVTSTAGEGTTFTVLLLRPAWHAAA